MKTNTVLRSTCVAMTLAGLVLLATGCVAGAYDHDNRAGQGPDYARQVFSLYDDANGAGAQHPAVLQFPLNIAVAEVGELAPPPVVLEQLRKETSLCHRVEGIPGIANGDYITSPYNVRDYPVTSPNGKDNALIAAAAMRRLIRLARDMGMDHLMLFGATVDSDVHATALSGLDLTIIGQFIVPSRDITARARASAVLIDLRTSRIVLSAGTQTDDKRAVSAADQGVGEDHLIKQLRDKAFAALGNQMIARCKTPSGALFPSPGNPGEGREGVGSSAVIGGGRRRAIDDGYSRASPNETSRGATDPFAGSASALSPGPSAVLSDPDAFSPGAPDPVPAVKH
jgi:hypothetical protein